MAPYSMDLRGRVLEDRIDGLASKDIAAKYRVSRSWVDRVYQRHRAGEDAPRRQTKFRARRLAGQDDQLRAIVAAQPDRTLVEIRAARGVPVALSTLWTALDRLNLSVKKTVRATERDRPDVVAQRETWRGAMLTRPAPGFVFLDETGVATDLIRRFGRAPRGHRVADQAPWGEWQLHTILAGLRTDGLVAPAVLVGPIDAESFRAYVEQILVPTLRPGDRVVLDNLNVHRDAASAAAIARAGATLHFLPPYSPDLNPIELAFAKLKAVLRATRPRSFDDICTRVAEALRLYSSAECAAYLRHCGYATL